MTAAQIRRSFVRYFEALDHRVVPSSSLVPQDDPTILFANAGMNQFKRVFQGAEKPASPRAVSVQKCIRAGGKHNDLENVGMTARHHTFFEMLGNFSFGDYFKKDAIAWAWEWVTGTLVLPKDRLYATVYTDDDEAFDLWKRVAPELAAGRILRFGKKDNYWAMGDTGPNGPCSEIHYDRGQQYSCGKPTCGPNCDCDRYMEIWNLVFMQFNTDESGQTKPLPKPSIDTGAGLERIAAVLQHARTNYDTDLFLPVIEALAKRSGRAYEPGEPGLSHRVVADHIRALSFAVADGALPSNEGRGYVLRRILRRAARHGRKLGLREPFLAELLPALITTMGEDYPELTLRRSHIAAVLTAEEEQFGRTLDVGIDLFEELAARAEKSASKTIAGDDVFKLYDTFGFPVDLTAVMARERGLEVDEAGFEAAMKVQRERSQGSREVFVHGAGKFHALTQRFAGKKSQFLYDTYETESPLIEYAPEEGAVILERTPFYVESGGQVSDTGMITSRDFVFEVKDVVRERDLILHLGEPLQGRTSKSASAQASVAKDRRRAIERNHTATHLLHAALRQVLGDHVHQAGSLVAPDRLRFDFTHTSALTREDLEQIETIVNVRVLDNIPLDIQWNDFVTAKAKGAMALFGEKYGDRVRVVNVPGFSMELCGGTHVKATGEIGLFRVLSEGAVASGVRRIEAATGEGARRHVMGRDRLLNTVSKLLKGDAESLPTRVEKLLEKQKELELKVRRLETEAARGMASPSNAAASDTNKPFTLQFGPEWQRERVTAVADEWKKSRDVRTGVFGFLDSERGKVNLFIVSSAGAVESGVDAGAAVGKIATSLGGRGGGKPNLGQGGFEGGGKSPEELKAMIEAAAATYFGSAQT